MGCCGITWPATYLRWFADSLPSEDVCTTSLLTVGGSPSPFWQFTWCSSIIRAKRSLKENYSSTIMQTRISNTILRYLRHAQIKLRFPLSRQLCLHTYYITVQTKLINQHPSYHTSNFQFGKKLFHLFLSYSDINFMLYDFWVLRTSMVQNIQHLVKIQHHTESIFNTSTSKAKPHFFNVCVYVCNTKKLKTIDMKHAQPSGYRPTHTPTSTQIKK